MRLRRPADHVRRVQRVAHLMELQGGLELVVALMLGVYWAANLSGPPRGEVARFGQVFLPIAAGFALITGTLKLSAWRLNREYRGRAVGMAALLAFPLTLCTVYCFPTGALLSIYGLWVYSQEAVRAAFAARARGASMGDVEAMLRGAVTPGPESRS